MAANVAFPLKDLFEIQRFTYLLNIQNPKEESIVWFPAKRNIIIWLPGFCSRTIIIHGTNDRSVDYATAKEFATNMTKLGNDFEFHTLEGAPHYIWFDGRYSGQVSKMRKAFLIKYGYE